METKQAVCPHCGSIKVIKHGFNRTVVGKFQRLQCQECGHTFYGDNKEAK